MADEKNFNSNRPSVIGSGFAKEFVQQTLKRLALQSRYTLEEIAKMYDELGSLDAVIKRVGDRIGNNEQYKRPLNG